MKRTLVAGLCALALLCVTIAGAAVTATPIFVQTVRMPKVQITNANGTTVQTLYACTTNGTKISGIFATSTDTSNRDVQLSVLKSATTYILATVAVPLGSGTVSGTAPVNLLAFIPGLPIDNDGNPYLYCETGDTIQAGMVVTLTSAKLMSVVAVAGDF